jgi:hypothetical protein
MHVTDAVIMVMSAEQTNNVVVKLWILVVRLWIVIGFGLWIVVGLGLRVVNDLRPYVDAVLFDFSGSGGGDRVPFVCAESPVLAGEVGLDLLASVVSPPHRYM